LAQAENWAQAEKIAAGVRIELPWRGCFSLAGEWGILKMVFIRGDV
jgi:hypothetical protein